VWQQLTARLLAPLIWLGRPVRLGWVVLLGAISILEFAYDYRPRLEVAAATLVDEHDPLTALFLITNPGRFHVNDLTFTCEVFSGRILLLTLKNNTARVGNEASIGQPPIERLNPGESATRDCLAGPQSRFIRIPIPDPATLRINFSVEYWWPWIWWKDSVSKHFSTRKSPDGTKFLLVPDIEH
jgi:hypothetical protein